MVFHSENDNPAPNREEAIGDVTRRYGLRRHGHVERQYDADWVLS